MVNWARGRCSSQVGYGQKLDICPQTKPFSSSEQPVCQGRWFSLANSCILTLYWRDIYSSGINIISRRHYKEGHRLPLIFSFLHNSTLKQFQWMSPFPARSVSWCSVDLPKPRKSVSFLIAINLPQSGNPIKTNVLCWKRKWWGCL